MQAYDSIISGYFCIGFIDFTSINERLVEFTNLFSANNFKKNDEITLEYFQQFDNWIKKKYWLIADKNRCLWIYYKYKWKKYIVVNATSIEN